MMESCSVPFFLKKNFFFPGSILQEIFRKILALLNTISLHFFDLWILPVSTSLLQNPVRYLDLSPPQFLLPLSFLLQYNPSPYVPLFHISNTTLISFYNLSPCDRIFHNDGKSSCFYYSVVRVGNWFAAEIVDD